MVKIAIAAAAVGIAALTAMVVYSGEGEQASKSEQVEPKLVGSQQSARAAYIDPSTGKLTSTPPASAAIQNNRIVQTNNRKLQPVEVINHSDGMIQINLNGNGMSSARVSLDCNGQVIAQHAEKPKSENMDCKVKK